MSHINTSAVVKKITALNIFIIEKERININYLAPYIREKTKRKKKIIDKN